MKKLFVILASLVLTSGLIYWTGPVVKFDTANPIIEPTHFSIDELDSFLTHKESQLSNLKPSNESRIVWVDSVRKTEYALVYLHGFSASVMESDPVHFDLARKYGMNLYLHRLAEHGIDSKDSFLKLTPKALVESAKEAVAIGQKIGNKVILMSCSTGGTLSIYLTAYNPEMIHAQILYSPNIALHDPLGTIVTMPWGEQLLRYSMGDYKIGNEEYRGTFIETYWTLDYRMEGIVALQGLLDQTMSEATFSMVQSPYFMGYYYKNEQESDHVVSVEAMQAFDQATSTPAYQKVIRAFPDVNNHVIGSDLRSEDLESVLRETSLFIENILKIPPIN